MQSRSGFIAEANMQERWEAALSLYSEARYQEALELLDGAAATPEVSILRGDLQMALGRAYEAAASYSAWVSIDAQNVRAHHCLAWCLRASKQWGRAERAYRKVLALDPGCDDARIGLGDCLLHLKRPEDALACFEECRAPASAAAVWFGKAVALQTLGFWEEAESLFLDVLGAQPQCSDALANLVALNIERFDLQRVERYALRLMEQAPDSPVALQALLIVAFERRQYEEASDYFSRWRQNLSTDDVSAPEEAVQYRLSKANVELLIQLRAQTGQQDSARPAAAGHRR